MRFEHSVSPQDVKYQFTGSASYDLPVGQGREVSLGGAGNAVLGGWTMNGILYIGTGVPIASPTSGTSPSYFNQRADLVCDPSHAAPHRAGAWFNAACFTVPGVPAGSADVSTANPFVPGTAPAYLDHVRTMGAKDLDLSIYKTFAFRESMHLRFEVSAYNVTNRAQFGMPKVPDMTTVLTQPDQAAVFGQIQSTVNTPRQFQFGSRFTF